MTTITIEQSLIEQAIESFVGYRREMRLMIGDEESEPCDAEKALCAALAAPESGAMAEIDYTDDDALRFIQRVLESDAPGADKKAARDMVVEIRTRVLKARASKPATAPDRHAQELLAQDITIANMRERHAQELCAYQITVDKLKAERKPMGTAERVRAFQAEPDPVSYEDFIRGIDAAEAHHGIGDKT